METPLPSPSSSSSFSALPSSPSPSGQPKVPESTSSTPIVETPSPITETPSIVKKPPPYLWYKDPKILAIIVSSFLALVFLIAYARKRTPCPPIPECKCPPSPPCPPCAICQTASQCPTCATCPTVTWEKSNQQGAGITETGSLGTAVDITTDTETLEKAQKWLLTKKAKYLNYPIAPCIRQDCITVNPGARFRMPSFITVPHRSLQQMAIPLMPPMLSNAMSKKKKVKKKDMTNQLIHQTFPQLLTIPLCPEMNKDALRQKLPTLTCPPSHWKKKRNGLAVVSKVLIRLLLHDASWKAQIFWHKCAKKKYRMENGLGSNGKTRNWGRK